MNKDDMQQIEILARFVSQSHHENPDELAFRCEPYVLASGAKVVRLSEMYPAWMFYRETVSLVLEALKQSTPTGNTT